MGDYYDKALKTAQSTYTNKTPDGFKKNKKLSDRRSKVYEDVHTGDIYFSQRGTDVKRPNDIIADGFILSGLQSWSPRFKASGDKLQKVQEQYKGRKIITSGHSLGGSQSVWLGKNYDGITASYGFNTGTNPRYEMIDNLRDKILNPKTDTQIHEYSTGNDPISLGIHLPSGKNTTRTIVAREAGLDPHTLDNFSLKP